MTDGVVGGGGVSGFVPFVDVEAADDDAGSGVTSRDALTPFGSFSPPPPSRGLAPLPLVSSEFLLVAPVLW